MKVINGDRCSIYEILGGFYRSEGFHPAIAEIGVLKGENAKVLAEYISFEHLTLIDSWSSGSVTVHDSSNRHRPWVVSDLDAYSEYYGGSLYKQETFDKLFSKVQEHFGGAENVSIMRSDSLKAATTLAELGCSFDLIYLDANHSFESVFDDLMKYSDLLSSDGLFQLNDCCFSHDGLSQNLGVLEASVRFCKHMQFIPLLVSNSDWTDVVFARKGSAIVHRLDAYISNSDVRYVDVPRQLLGSLRVVGKGQTKNISFC